MRHHFTLRTAAKPACSAWFWLSIFTFARAKSFIRSAGVADFDLFHLTVFWGASMLFRTNIFILFTFILASNLYVGSLISSVNAKDAAIAQANFSGTWVHQAKPASKMRVREDAGVYRVTGSDESYGYNLSCLVKNMKAVCMGTGGRLEGENFLYQSTIDFQSDGSAIENWTAFNNQQTVAGKIVWIRP